MKPQAALVRADGVVVLHAVSAVDLDLALVVHPRHPEEDRPVGLHKALQQPLVLIFGMLVENGAQRFQHFPDRLQEFLLMTVSLFQIRVYPGYISVHAIPSSNLDTGRNLRIRKIL